MRACFLGQNICALGFGVATLQTPPLMVEEQTGKRVGPESKNQLDPKVKKHAPAPQGPRSL